MRWIRLLIPMLFARFRSRLNIEDTSTLEFRVWLTDVDATIMNHAAMMTVFEAGRLDFMVRMGFFQLARQQKWYFPNSGMHVQFFRPLKLFQKATVNTRVLHIGEEFIYAEQWITRQGKEVAVCVSQTKVKKERADVNTGEIAALLNLDELPRDKTRAVEAYEKNNAVFKERLRG